jgi:hypothetical protein
MCPCIRMSMSLICCLILHSSAEELKSIGFVDVGISREGNEYLNNNTYIYPIFSINYLASR